MAKTRKTKAYRAPSPRSCQQTSSTACAPLASRLPRTHPWSPMTSELGATDAAVCQYYPILMARYNKRSNMYYLLLLRYISYVHHNTYNFSHTPPPTLFSRLISIVAKCPANALAAYDADGSITCACNSFYMVSKPMFWTGNAWYVPVENHVLLDTNPPPYRMYNA